MFKGKVVAFALMLLMATSAYAGDVNPCYSTTGVSCTGMVLSMCPANDFDYIRDGCGGGFDYIWIIAKDNSNSPIQNIPATDYWLNSCDPAYQFCLCAQPLIADSLTNELGRTTFTGRITGGGCSLSEGIWLAIQGKVIQTAACDGTAFCLPVVVKSPDVTGAGGQPDCKVDLSDLIQFSGSYNLNLGAPGYNGCCDWNHDDMVNLSDLAYLATHYQHDCY